MIITDPLTGCSEDGSLIDMLSTLQALDTDSGRMDSLVPLHRLEVQLVAQRKIRLYEVIAHVNATLRLATSWDQVPGLRAI